MAFKERLQYLIDLKKISQAELAKGIRSNESRISEWLSGKVNTPRKVTAQKLADFFGCNVDWLFSGDGTPFTEKSSEKTYGNYAKSAHKVNQVIGDNQIHNIYGQQELSPSEAYLIDLIRQVPDKETYIRSLVGMTINELNNKDKD